MTENVESDRDWVANPPDKKDAPNLGRDYVRKKIVDFGLDRFLGEHWQDYIEDIIWIRSNAGDKVSVPLRGIGFASTGAGKTTLLLGLIVSVPLRGIGFASMLQWRGLR